jgi:hypothetical protein
MAFQAERAMERHNRRRSHAGHLIYIPKNRGALLRILKRGAS